MKRATRNPAADLRGATRLVVEATEGVAGIVEDMQGPTLGIAGLVHRGIRGVTRLVGGGVDALLAPFVPLLGETRSRPAMEAALAVLNGVVGDHLAATGNPARHPHAVAPGRRAARAPARRPGRGAPRRRRKILILVHGSCMNDLRWNRRGHDHGAALARDLGYTAGLPPLQQRPARLHERARARVAPRASSWTRGRSAVEELSIVAHSMGGLVTRSACHQAGQAGQRWPRLLRKLVFLGTPHHGAPGRAARQLGERGARRRPLHRPAGPPAQDPQRRRHRPAPRQPPRRGLAGARPVPAAGPDRRRPVPLPRGSEMPGRGRLARRRGRSAPSGATGSSRWTARWGVTATRRWTLDLPRVAPVVAYGTDHFDLLDRPRSTRASGAGWRGSADGHERRHRAPERRGHGPDDPALGRDHLLGRRARRLRRPMRIRALSCGRRLVEAGQDLVEPARRPPGRAGAGARRWRRPAPASPASSARCAPAGSAAPVQASAERSSRHSTCTSSSVQARTGADRRPPSSGVSRRSTTRGRPSGRAPDGPAGRGTASRSRSSSPACPGDRWSSAGSARSRSARRADGSRPVDLGGERADPGRDGRVAVRGPASCRSRTPGSPVEEQGAGHAAGAQRLARALAPARARGSPGARRPARRAPVPGRPTDAPAAASTEAGREAGRPGTGSDRAAGDARAGILIHPG